mgnify:CR=1 FL=1
MFSANIFTLYPDVFPGVLGQGIYERASKNNIWKLNVKNIRDYASDKHSTVDDKPFGGGSGMVMKADVIDKCLDKNLNNFKTYYLSPRGKVFDQDLANQISNFDGINLLCGHFEGIDQRVLDHRKIEEISIGDFILSGGESAAIIILDAVLRLIPGVLGNENSAKDESFSSSKNIIPIKYQEEFETKISSILINLNKGEEEILELDRDFSLNIKCENILYTKDNLKIKILI